MISNKILPAHILRGYIWDAFVANGAPLEKTADGLLPIIPLTDQPLLAQTGNPYIIYAFAEDSSTEITEVRGGLFVLRIITQTFGQLGEIENIVARAFENEDVSAANVNLWSSTKPEFVGLRFTTINLQYTEGGMPADEEGGAMEGTMNIHYKYVTQQKIKLFGNATVSRTTGQVSGGTWV